MIVRIMGEGQWRMDDGSIGELSRLDDEAGAAVERGDGDEVAQLLERMASFVRERGERLDDADLHPSDAIVPPTDLTLEEARELFSGEGLIPDLPVA